MKDVLISIRPKWCELIAQGKKTVEVRKTRPKIDVPFKCYIYMSKGQRELLDVWKKGDLIWDDIYYEQDKPQFVKGGYKYEHTPYFQKVIGEFVCDCVSHIHPNDDGFGVNQYVFTDLKHEDNDHCLTFAELKAYIGEKWGFGWHISDLVIYDKPRELSEFFTRCNDRKCRECQHSIEHRTDYGENNVYIENVCKYDRLKPIARPPQSWCYVEEVNE